MATVSITVVGNDPTINCYGEVVTSPEVDGITVGDGNPSSNEFEGTFVRIQDSEGSQLPCNRPSCDPQPIYDLVDISNGNSDQGVCEVQLDPTFNDAGELLYFSLWLVDTSTCIITGVVSKFGGSTNSFIRYDFGEDGLTVDDGNVTVTGQFCNAISHIDFYYLFPGPTSPPTAAPSSVPSTSPAPTGEDPGDPQTLVPTSSPAPSASPAPSTNPSPAPTICWNGTPPPAPFVCDEKYSEVALFQKGKTCNKAGYSVTVDGPCTITYDDFSCVNRNKDLVALSVTFSYTGNETSNLCDDYSTMVVKAGSESFYIDSSSVPSCDLSTGTCSWTVKVCPPGTTGVSNIKFYDCSIDNVFSGRTRHLRAL